MTEEVINDHFFARKVAVGEVGLEFYIAACDKLGIERSAEVPKLPATEAKDHHSILFDLIKRNVNIPDTTLSCGIMGEKYLCDIVFGSDGLLHYNYEPPGAMGYEWCWGDGGLDITSRGEKFARFDGLRVHEGKLFILGYWHHANVLTLACVADIGPILVAPAVPDLHATRYADLTECVWSCWFSNYLVSELVFNPDGTVWKSGSEDKLEGFWRMQDDALLTFGIHSMPIALFEHRSVNKDGARQVAGVSWGRRLPIEPCLLVSRHAR